MIHPRTLTAAAAPQADRFVWRAEIAETVKLAWPMALTQLGQIAMMTTSRDFGQGGAQHSAPRNNLTPP
jgi:hypothetical protein